MRAISFTILFAFYLALCACSGTQTQTETQTQTKTRTINFSGYEWTVVNASGQGPGPNNWDDNNVWVDEKGALHLKITHRGTQWYCAKLAMKQRLGYGLYSFEVIGRVDELDPNVVLGLFNYPTPDVGADGTHEIDIEFAKWGNPRALNGGYTVWPAKEGLNRAFERFDAKLNSVYTTHSFEWNKASVLFRSANGYPEGERPAEKDKDNRTSEIASWSYTPKDPANYIGKQAMPILINLWLFQGHAPTDGKEIEIIVSSFKFTPR